MTITSIAISGQCSSGKSTLCRVLTNKLGWKHVNVGNEFKRIAVEHGLQIENFGSIPEDILRAIDDQIERRIQTEHNVIWDSRLTCYLARKYENVYKIYCKADCKVRAQRTSDRDKISLKEAIHMIRTRDQEEKAVFKRLYGISNPFNKEWIDLVIDTSNNTPEELANIVVKTTRVLEEPQV